MIAPLALLTFVKARTHRRWGQSYVLLMTLLYITGTILTFTRHPLDSDEFRRNLSFNFLGFYLLFLGWRAIHGYTHPKSPQPRNLDWVLLAVLAIASLALFLTGRVPMRRIAMICMIFVLVDYWEFHRHNPLSRQRLYARHVRYMIASFCYVLTVVSIVHLGVMDRKLKWLWPSLLGMAALAMASHSFRAQAKGIKGPAATRGLKAAVYTLLTGTYIVFIYIVWAVATGRLDPFHLRQASGS